MAHAIALNTVSNWEQKHMLGVAWGAPAGGEQESAANRGQGIRWIWVIALSIDDSS